MSELLTNFDIAGFWEPSDWANETYRAPVPSPADIATVERTLGFTLPPAYVEFMSVQNGGVPSRNCHRVAEATNWAPDHVAVTGLFAIGSEPGCSLLGRFGSEFWIEEWGYPPIGIYFADTPTGGHDMFCLDYSGGGPTGEPRIVHVDQEAGYRTTHVAVNFEAFIRGLEEESNFDDDEP